MKQKLQVIIDPAHNIAYSTFYLGGFNKVIGRVSYSSKYFDNLPYNIELMRCVIKYGNSLKRIVIDYYDYTTIHPDDLKWCDLYAKINYNPAVISTLSEIDRAKVINIPPSFGVKHYGLFSLCFLSVINLAKGFNRIFDKKNYLLNYLRQYVKRLPIHNYKPSNSSLPNYIFTLNSIWCSARATNREINQQRLDFIQVADSIPGVHLEGGMMDIGNNRSYLEDVDKYLHKKKISLRQYLKNINKSTCVFNSPAAEKCLGWKLPEYMSMGKAIICSELYNQLPVPLEHGVNVHFVSKDKAEIKAAIELLVNDPVYRKKLEDGAYKYYVDYVAPEKVVRYILDKVIDTRLCMGIE